MHSDATADKITQIINTSLAEGTVSDNLKEAILHPLLKKLNLDVMTFKNYHPVSNLAYISKLLEWVVCGQLTQHVEGTGNVEPMQSPYRPNNSTEMALLLLTDLLDAIDKKEVTCLVLLDLSAAFDTVNHSILLQCLKYRFGIQGRVLDWITSYHTNQTQKVMIDDLESDPVELSRGVPQGSVLGPVLFNLYTSSLGDICKSHGIKYHQYANDTQNYFSFKPAIPGDNMHCIRTLQNCIKDIRIWMHTNMLKLTMTRQSSL